MKTDRSPKVARDLVRLHGLRARAVAEERARQAASPVEMLLWARAASLVSMLKTAEPAATMRRIDVMRGCAALPEAA